MTYLGRDAILGAPDVEYEDVPVPQWGGTVRVRGMTALERDKYESMMVHIKEDGAKGNRRQRRQKSSRVYERTGAQIRATACAWCIVDENGRRVFSAADVEVLGSKSARALENVFDVIVRLSGLDEDDEQESMVEDPLGDSPSA